MSAGDRDRAIRLRQAGLSYRAIGQRLGVSAPTARAWVLGLHGAAREPDGRTRRERRDIAQVNADLARRYRNRGWPVRRIADALGCSRSHVHRLLRSRP